jgi:FlaA1/EpsC-like NDP-sugar epimerase
MRSALITYRRFFVVLVHLALWTAAFLASVLLRFEFALPRPFLNVGERILVLTLLVRAVFHWRIGLFHGLWRYSGSRDLMALLKATTFSSIAVAVAWAFTGSTTFPRSIFILDWAFCILLVGGLRFGIRSVREVTLQNAHSIQENGKRRRLLIIGAGDAGEMLMREITRLYLSRYKPVGFLDDSPAKQNARIHDVPVLGLINDVALVTKREEIDEIILAIPSLGAADVRRIVALCAPCGVTMRTLPGVDSLIDGSVTVSQLSEVAIEDLLGRDPVTLETDAIEKLLHGRSVLVTGAGGSIGSELCKQVCRFSPKVLVLIEQAENNLFEVHRALLAQFPKVKVIPYVADICDVRRLETIFAAERPAVVFHAAAHKHVPMMESNPGEAIKNNVFGTKKVADTADKFGVEKFVMVSTDKAVNPTSVMGVSKRTAEIYAQSLSSRSRTQFVTVRFGNVLGSAGSVVPIFKEQIRKGGPVTVTHPDMQRYFMTIPEASQLILQAGAMGRGGEIFILDMGAPVKIVDLARDLIRLSGLKPDEDIMIAFSGIRPGEKLYEELSVDTEHATKTRHPKIFVGKSRVYEWSDVTEGLTELHTLTNVADPPAIRDCFRKLVPEYVTPDHVEAPIASGVGEPELAEDAPLLVAANGDRISITAA